MKNQFESVELHAVDDESFLTVSLVAQCLLKYKYVTLARLKTKTHQTILKKDDIKNPKDEDFDNRVILQPKLVVHLTKTADFDSIYDTFELAFKKMKEEHAEDIQEIEKSAIKAVAEENADVDAWAMSLLKILISSNWDLTKDSFYINYFSKIVQKSEILFNFDKF